MDDQQWQQYTQGLAQQEIDRRAVQSTREEVKDLIRQTTTCDGTTTASVRLWIREVTLAYNRLGANHVIEITTKTVTGPLRFQVERFIEKFRTANNVSRATIPWTHLREHIAEQFLNVDEAAALRDEIEKVKQSEYEPAAQYSRRFRQVADTAYPYPRNEDQERLLIKLYARGLHSDELARKLVQDVSPTDLETAISAISRINERHDAYARLRREEEPMEVGVINPEGELQRQLASVVGTVEKLATKLAKLEASPRSTPVSQPQRTNVSGKPNRKEITCHHCGKAGHVWRECRQRQGQRIPDRREWQNQQTAQNNRQRQPDRREWQSGPNGQNNRQNQSGNW